MSTATDPRLDLFSLAPVASQLDNGNRVFLRRFTGAERLAWFERIAAGAAAAAAAPSEDKGKINFRAELQDEAFLLAIGLCNEQGTRLFADNELERIPQLIDAQEIDRLALEILNLNGIGSAAKEDLKKKSPEHAPDSTSSPSSPEPSAPAQ